MCRHVNMPMMLPCDSDRNQPWCTDEDPHWLASTEDCPRQLKSMHAVVQSRPVSAANQNNGHGSGPRSWSRSLARCHQLTTVSSCLQGLTCSCCRNIASCSLCGCQQCSSSCCITACRRHASTYASWYHCAALAATVP